SNGYKILSFQTYKAVCLIPQVYRVSLSNPLIVKGDEEFGKRKGLFQVPSFSDPLGVFTVAVYIFDL
ncbi:hypothetical protein, partial [Phocaeicola vulgatus]|uniref:hypothetical protein n=1 Tax=Phocaeicola vulgatus TaxID=821 RepID=UPI0035670B3A